jgi:hypothetical protein
VLQFVRLRGEDPTVDQAWQSAPQCIGVASRSCVLTPVRLCAARRWCASAPWASCGWWRAPARRRRAAAASTLRSQAGTSTSSLFRCASLVRFAVPMRLRSALTACACTLTWRACADPVPFKLLGDEAKGCAAPSVLRFTHVPCADALRAWQLTGHDVPERARAREQGQQGHHVHPGALRRRRVMPRRCRRHTHAL